MTKFWCCICKRPVPVCTVGEGQLDLFSMNNDIVTIVKDVIIQARNQRRVLQQFYTDALNILIAKDAMTL